MNSTLDRTKSYHLVEEMYATIELVRAFNVHELLQFFQYAENCKKWIITGEGSSRIFPGKNVLCHRMKAGCGPDIFVQDATQLRGLNLEGYLVLGASNSGKTKELIDLFSELKMKNHANLVAMSSYRETPLTALVNSFLCTDFCVEKAVAATQSVIIQALVYDLLLTSQIKREFNLNALSEVLEGALIQNISSEVVHSLGDAETIYFVGADNGVAEELTLKTMETIRKRSVFLPGTLLLHGIEEIVTNRDVLIIIDPLPDYMERIASIYIGQIGCKIVLMGQVATGCLSIQVPACNETFFSGYQRLALGWNLLATVGIEMGIDIDKPQRARKIGNSYKPE